MLIIFISCGYGLVLFNFMCSALSNQGLLNYTKFKGVLCDNYSSSSSPSPTINSSRRCLLNEFEAAQRLSPESLPLDCKNPIGWLPNCHWWICEKNELAAELFNIKEAEAKNISWLTILFEKNKLPKNT